MLLKRAYSTYKTSSATILAQIATLTGIPTLKSPTFPRLYCPPLAHSPTEKQMLLLDNSNRKLLSIFRLADMNPQRRDIV